MVQSRTDPGKPGARSSPLVAAEFIARFGSGGVADDAEWANYADSNGTERSYQSPVRKDERSTSSREKKNEKLNYRSSSSNAHQAAQE
jgi:hypothetical protein